MKNRSLEAFHRDMKKYNVKPQEVAVKFPYAKHEGFQAFECEYNDAVYYFCFNADNELIQSQLVSYPYKS